MENESSFKTEDLMKTTLNLIKELENQLKNPELTEEQLIVVLQEIEDLKGYYLAKLEDLSNRNKKVDYLKNLEDNIKEMWSDMDMSERVSALGELNNAKLAYLLTNQDEK